MYIYFLKLFPCILKGKNVDYVEDFSYFLNFSFYPNNLVKGVVKIPTLCTITLQKT